MGIVISQYKDPYVTPIRVINGMSALITRNSKNPGEPSSKLECNRSF